MSKVKNFFSPKRLAIMAMFIALQIILARFVGLQISEGLRISFEAIPVLLSSLWLGPVAGAIVGFLSDLLGTIISGYGVYFLPLAITPILNGVLPWVFAKFAWKNKMNVWKCIITVVLTEIIASLFCGTYALTWYFTLFVPAKDAAFTVLLISRLTKFATIAVDAVIVATLHTSLYKKVIRPVVEERR
ncbi:MAG: folate family ECF transporter S component [Eubacterium sp.]|nr:folate family ECF transporter S component [Eubacterium sp.]MBR3276592.1 folate family ECF transporter S component [Eubacterium sp.]